VPAADLLDYHDGVWGVSGAAAAAEVAGEEALCCRCGGHGEGLVLPWYLTTAEVCEGRGRWSAARERTRRIAVAEASGGAGALVLERRRRRRAARRRGRKMQVGGRGRTGMVGPTGLDAK
jgi:hypothetical protein